MREGGASHPAEAPASARSARCAHRRQSVAERPKGPVRPRPVAPCRGSPDPRSGRERQLNGQANGPRPGANRPCRHGPGPERNPSGVRYTRTIGPAETPRGDPHALANPVGEHGMNRGDTPGTNEGSGVVCGAWGQHRRRLGTQSLAALDTVQAKGCAHGRMARRRRGAHCLSPSVRCGQRPRPSAGSGQTPLSGVCTPTGAPWPSG